jgi:anti-sigma factor RsiW
MQVPEDDEIAALVRREARRHAPPATLGPRIQEAVRASQPPVEPARRRPPWRWLQSLAIFGAGAATAWGLALSLWVAPTSDAVGEAVAASHVRSLMGSHLTDVASSDHHTVKPWFSGKLDFSPPVVELADRGLPLAGGRLDYLDGRPVAALVYTSGSHVINLFAWPAGTSAASAPQARTRLGYNLIDWTQAGMRFWAVSDLNAKELEAFAALVRERAEASR